MPDTDISLQPFVRCVRGGGGLSCVEKILDRIALKIKYTQLSREPGHMLQKQAGPSCMTQKLPLKRFTIKKFGEGEKYY